MFANLRSPLEKSRRAGLGGSSAAWIAGMLSLVGILPSHAAAVQQQATDTIPLAPIEVRVLRTPFLTNAAPFAVAVRTEEELREGRGGVYIEEALQGMPGVQVQNRFNPAIGERIMIRGFGARAQFGLRGFRVVVDGIPATLPDGQASLDHLDIGSLGRVEVMRGPASALFGNGGGGVLAFSTRAPSTSPLEVDVEAVGGSAGLMRGQGTVSGTRGSTGFLVSAYGVTADGFREVPEASPRFDTLQAYGSFERIGANARITRPALGGQLAITANVLDLGAENPGSTRVKCTEGTTPAGCFTAGTPPSAAPFYGVENTYLLFRTRKDVTQQQGGVQWTGPTGGFDSELSLYAVHRTVFNPLPVDVVDLSRMGYGLRVASGRGYALSLGDLEWRAGLDLDIQSDDRQEFASAGGEPDGDATLDQEEAVRGVGVFLQTNLALSGGAAILGGIRYDSQRFEATDRVPVTVDNPDDSGTRTMSAVSPSIGIDVPLAGLLNVFGSVSTLFETPTTTELANQETAPGGFNPDLDPMDGVSYEVGVRGDIASLAAIEVTVYQTNLNNELIAYEVEGQPGITFFQNAGSSKHQGIEATLSVANSSGLFRGDLTYTYTDARFEEYVDRTGADFADNQVPGVSPRRIQALLRLNPAMWFAELVATSMDDVPANDANTAYAPAYEVVDLRVGLEGVSVANIVLAPWAAITNLTDEEYVSSIAVNANGSRFFEPGPARSFQVGLRARFGGN